MINFIRRLSRHLSQTHDFHDGRGPVPAHRHPNGGGWIARTAYVHPSAYVGPNAVVFDVSRVGEHAEIHNDVRVSGTSTIHPSAVVNGFGVQIRGAADIWHECSESPISITGLRAPFTNSVFTVTRYNQWLVIGCKCHSIKEWQCFSPAEIAAMGYGAIEFWREHNERLLSL